MVHFNADMKLGVILSDGLHRFQRVLPNRLERIRDQCEVDNKNYPQSRTAFLEADDRQHEGGLP